MYKRVFKDTQFSSPQRDKDKKSHEGSSWDWA